MKKLIQRFWPLFFIIFLWFIFSSPFFLRGQIPFPGDYQVTFFPPWSQYSQFSGPVKNNAMPDVVDQLYPWKNLVINDWKNGQIPLWNPYQFVGTPLLANYQSAVFSPMNVLFFVFPFKIGWGFLILLQPLFAGLGMYWFVRKLSVSQIGATMSSVSFMFCSFLVTWMGYGTLGYAIGVLPFVLLGIEGFAQSKKFGYFILISASIAFSFLSGHFQMSLYTLLAAFLYFLFLAVTLKNKRFFVLGFLGLSVGFLIASVQIFPSIAFYAQSLRSTIFARPEVIPFSYFVTLIAPDFLGNPITRNDWFGHYAEWGSYIGVLPLVFALFSLFLFKKNKFIVFFAGLGFLSFLLATPTFLGNLVLDLHIPVLATSAAGRIIVLLSFSLAVLAGFGVDAWHSASEKKKLILAAVAVALLAVGWFTIFYKLGLNADHDAIAKQNFILPSILLMSIILGTIVVHLLKRKFIVSVVIFIFLLLTAFDMYRFAAKWQSFSPSFEIFPNIQITNFFKTIMNERSLGNYGGQVSLYYQLPAVEGYDALYPQRIGEFTSFVGSGSVQSASRSVVDFPKNGRYTKDAINLLGIRYIIHKISDTNESWTFPVWQYPLDFKPVYQDREYTVFENKKVFPRAFMVGDYTVEPNKEKNLLQLFLTDRSKKVILEEDPKIEKNSSLIAKATISSYLANKVTINTTSNATSLLFLSDTYFPGWHTYVDGKETKIFQADYAFRAVVVAAGKHTVVFSYWPDSFVFGVWGSVAGIVILGICYFFQKKSV